MLTPTRQLPLLQKLQIMAKKLNKLTGQIAQATSPAYRQLVADATERVQSGQLAAFRAVNKELIQLYWDLGKMILERQQANGWGDSVVEMLAKDLRKLFPRMRGLSAANLWRMRAFFLFYGSSEILALLVREIGWSHNVIIFEKCKDPNERLFYIHQTRRFGWTKNV